MACPCTVEETKPMTDEQHTAVNQLLGAAQTLQGEYAAMDSNSPQAAIYRAAISKVQAAAAYAGARLPKPTVKAAKKPAKKKTKSEA